jgi:hypothetical protein
MRRRIARIPQRRPIYLGCEGRSEAGYGALLNRLALERQVHIHIHAESLQPGAGDPLALVEKAVQRIRHLERARAPFAVTAVLLDVGAPQKNAEAIALAQQNGIGHMIWQAPDHEALLLRHLPGCDTLRPPAGASLGVLRQNWPNYEKGMAAQQLAQRLGFDHVRQACQVEQELRAFLTAIGLL